MLSNYFKLAFRNATRQKGYSITNILGLAAGIAVCLLIFLVVRFETSFDRFHSQKEHIYRVVSVFKEPQGIDYEPGVPFPTAPALRQDYPQLKNVADILSLGGDGQITVPDSNGSTQLFKEETGILYSEPQFFSIFDFPWLAGDKSTALKEPNTVVLTQTIAEKYFGNWQNAIGRSIILDKLGSPLRVTGILADMPANTDFPLKVVISYSSLKNTGLAGMMTSDWIGIFAQHYCFVVLPDRLSEAQFDKDLTTVVHKYKPVQNHNEGMMLLPLTQMHFDTRYNLFNNHPFGKNLIWALSLIGIFVLSIACVNFVNLATAQAINRSKEVGIRKVLGSARGQLFAQFLSEAALIVLLAALLAIGICTITLPWLNRILDMHIDRQFLADPAVLVALASMILGSTVLSGFYPAIVLSGFNPINAIKNKASIKTAGPFSLRRILVVIQFTISQGLIIGVLIVVAQMDYFRSAPLGFDKDAMMITHIPGTADAVSKIESLRNSLRQIPGVKSVSFSFASPIDNNDWNNDIAFNNVPQHDFGAFLKFADPNYAETYRLKLLAGRFYGNSDTIKDLVVNETFIKKLGIRDPAAALGAKVEMTGEHKSGSIVGVVKDFNIASLRDSVSPVILGTWKDTYQTVNIKLAASGMEGSLAAIAQLWKSAFPGQVYDYRFLDETLAGYYKQEGQLSVLYKIFAAIAIFISGLGLYSLVSYMAVQRAKEVGIRKTLGASVGSIVYLFTRELTWLIGIAFLIAAPLMGYIMHRWLQNYAFHIHPGPGVFALAIAVSALIAWLSVGYKAIRAALVNPVDSLKTE